jgi:hypothetical protein
MAGTITQAVTSNVAPVKVITFTCTADASDGSYPATTVSAADVKGSLLQIVTDPDGTTAPQDNYDITLTESGGADMLLGVGANRDTANTEIAIVESNGARSVVAETDTLTLNITNNNVNSAVITIKLYWIEGV